MSIFGDEIDEYNCAPVEEAELARQTYRCPEPPAGARFHILHAGVLNSRSAADFDLRYWLTHHNVQLGKRDWVVLAYQVESNSEVRKTPHRRYACHFISADWKALLETPRTPDTQNWSQLCASAVFSTRFCYRPPQHRVTRFEHFTINAALLGTDFTFDQPDYESLLECMETMAHRNGFLKNASFDVPTGFDSPSQVLSSMFSDSSLARAAAVAQAAAMVAMQRRHQLILSRFLFRTVERVHCRLLAEMMCGLPFHYQLDGPNHNTSLAFRIGTRRFQFAPECHRYKSTDWVLFFRLLARVHWVVHVDVKNGLQYTKPIGRIAWAFPSRATRDLNPYIGFMPHRPTEEWHHALVDAGFRMPSGHAKWQATPSTARVIPLKPAWDQFLEYVTTLYPLRFPALVLQTLLTFAEPWLELLTEEEMVRIVAGVNSSCVKAVAKRDVKK